MNKPQRPKETEHPDCPRDMRDMRSGERGENEVGKSQGNAQSCILSLLTSLTWLETWQGTGNHDQCNSKKKEGNVNVIDHKSIDWRGHVDIQLSSIALMMPMMPLITFEHF